MDHEIVELQNELRRTLQETVSDTVDGRYFPDIDYRPKHPNDLLKATNLHFLAYDGDKQTVRYVDDVFTAAEVVVDVPHFAAEPSSSDWLDRIVSFSVRLELPDVGVVHDDVVQWERYEREGERTGRLKHADEEVITDEIGPLAGIRECIEFGLSDLLPEHDGRSEETDIPLAFVRNATPDDWRKLDDVRPTGF